MKINKIYKINYLNDIISEIRNKILQYQTSN